MPEAVPVNVVNELLKNAFQVSRVLVVVVERKGGEEHVVHCELRDADEAEGLYAALSAAKAGSPC